MRTLRDANVRFAEGLLQPERTALTARALVALGRAPEAKKLLLALEPRPTLDLLSARIATAEALVGHDDSGARTLIEPCLRSEVPPGLRKRGEQVARRIEESEAGR